MIIYFRNTFSVWYILTISLLASCYRMPQNEVNHQMVKDSLYYTNPITLGILSDPQMDEISGIVSTTGISDHLWAHNDNGDKARLFLINLRGELIQTVTLDGVKNRDWEDIASFKDTHNGKTHLYIGDIGDNDAKYSFCQVHIIEEPAYKPSSLPTIVTPIKTITYTYPDGPRDAETLMVDPQNGDIYIITKREQKVGIYKIAYPYQSGSIVATKLAELPYKYIVGGDIARDRSAMIIKDYEKIYYFSLSTNQKIDEALLTTPYLPPYFIEPQGESIAWASDSKTFYTLSETSFAKIAPVLYKYEKGK